MIAVIQRLTGNTQHARIRGWSFGGIERSGAVQDRFIYDGVEPIDLATFGVLSMARRIAPEIRDLHHRTACRAARSPMA